MTTLLVTGGSAGIGAATARMGAARGYDHVVVTYSQDAKGADAILRDIEEAGATGHAIRADVRDAAALSALFDRIGDLPPAPLHLVNNAGVVTPTGSLADLTPDRVRAVFEVNVLGAFEVARLAVAYMQAHHGGHVVNISSAAARHGSPGQYVDYAATKGAIETFSVGIAHELAADGIRVNALRPGLIETEIHAKGGVPDRLEKIGHTPPLGRPGTADEVAEGILWLLSDAASYVTGTVLDVTGGR
ncbi:SDR family oxidoreductase [Marivita hallyeonensis]|uniref:NAD(P)-dependent dehydrogenase, short-chain alcohol dehydrogenase family n=1 Tax=Marivita hallyeonensis TaxID=996342 RepID=A0A1M5W1S0_9RHOB|nr:SDR family oxidoreductase [Marivita hallyeonensis]SHH81456.1 NAD(P)-dependent dehydrogenase, short-chain alcohol dehydrogenase family [Marivita hallyeonensis]